MHIGLFLAVGKSRISNLCCSHNVKFLKLLYTLGIILSVKMQKLGLSCQYCRQGDAEQSAVDKYFTSNLP